MISALSKFLLYFFLKNFKMQKFIFFLVKKFFSAKSLIEQSVRFARSVYFFFTFAPYFFFFKKKAFPQKGIFAR